MATNYIDFSNRSQYATSSLFRPPKYMRVGNSIVRSPTEFRLSDLYAPKNIYTPLPQTISKPPQVAPVLPQQPPEAIGVTNTPNVEGYVEKGGWQKWNTIQGNEVWMPTKRADGTPIQDGDIYNTADGGKYVWSQAYGKWLKLAYKSDPETGEAKWVIDDQSQPFIALNLLGNDVKGKPVEYVKVGNTGQTLDQLKTQYNALLQNINGTVKSGLPKDVAGGISNIRNSSDIDSALSQLNRQKNIIESYIKGLKESLNSWYSFLYSKKQKAEFKRKLNQAQAVLDPINAKIDYLKAAKENLVSLENQINNYKAPPTEGVQQGYQELSNITNWQTQLQDTIDKFRKGEISTNPEDLKNGSWAEQWLGNVIEQAQKTGLLVTPFTDENGNLSPEIQNIIDSYNENIANQHMETMKNLRLAAIQRGHSPNDVYYNEALSNWQADVSMQIANNISNMLVGEMQDSYQFTSNALADALKASGRATEAEALQTQMENQWAQALDDYKMQIEALAQEMADTEAARQGQIVTAIVGLITSILGAVI